MKEVKPEQSNLLSVGKKNFTGGKKKKLYRGGDSAEKLESQNYLTEVHSTKVFLNLSGA